ncbi:MAG: vWA domain-containing protein [candidate division KSB1 bacterium]|nr:vWA domain-containing protein [candidate division KSB1 bacterium]
MCFLGKSDSVVKLFLIVVLVFLNTATAQFTQQQDEKGMDLIILLDRSGSMPVSDEDGLAVAAVKAVASQMAFLQGRNRLLLLPFGTQVHYVPQKQDAQEGYFTNDFKGFMEELDEFQKRYPLKGGYTDLEMAMLKAREIFETQSSNDQTKHVIVITDGMPIPDFERYPSLSSDQMKKKSRDNILKIAKLYSRRRIRMTLFGLFSKEKPNDKLLATAYMNKIKNQCGGSFVEVESASDIISNVLEFFPEPPDILDLYQDPWNKSISIPQEFAIQESQVYIVMGRNQVRQFPDLNITGNPTTVYDNNGNIAFIAVRTRDQQILKPSKLPFTPDIFIKGRTRLEPALNITPRREEYAAGDRIKFVAELIDPDTQESVPVQRISGDFISPEYSSRIYFDSDSAEFTIPDEAENSTAKLRLDYFLSDHISLTQMLYWPIASVHYNRFMIDPELTFINFGELGNRLETTYNLSQYKLTLAEPNLRRIEPKVEFMFDEGLLASDWFPQDYKLPAINRSRGEQIRSVPLKDISISVPNYLPPEFKDKKYTGMLRFYADNVEELLIPFSLIFNRPDWDLPYQYKNERTDDIVNENNLLFINFFNNIFRSKKLFLPLRHNSAYAQAVSVRVDSTLSHGDEYIETKKLSLTGDPENDLELEAGKTSQYTLRLNRNGKIPSQTYEAQIRLTGARLPAVTIPVNISVAGSFASLRNPAFYLVILLFLVLVVLVIRQKKQNAIHTFKNQNSMTLPVKVTSDTQKRGKTI